MTKQIIRLVAFILLMIPVTGIADDDKYKGTLLNLAATEHAVIDEDLLTATLRFEAEDASAKIVQSKINDTMKKVINEAKKFGKVETSTEEYSVYKYTLKTNKEQKKDTLWRASQSLSVSGYSSEDLLKLTGDLQKMGLVISSLNYSVSTNKKEEAREALMEAAIEKILNKAKRVAKALGKNEIKVANINIDSNTPSQSMQLFSMNINSGAKSNDDDPIAIPGKNRISMTVQATILIKD
jgi:predicted secreted protein